MAAEDWYERSTLNEMNHLTFAKNFPLASLGAPLLRHQITQLVVEFFHLVAALSFRQLMANAEFWRATIWLPASWRPGILVAEVTNLLVLQRVMMVRCSLKLGRGPGQSIVIVGVSVFE